MKNGPSVFVMLVCGTLIASSSVEAQVANWQTGETIAGTEDVTLGPHVRLNNWSSDERNLRHGDFSGLDLSFSGFSESWLDNARFTGANLSASGFSVARLTDVDFSDAVVFAAGLWHATRSGFTSEQLYSTRSYRNKNLQGVELWFNDLSNWDFTGQNLHYAEFFRADLTNANFTNAVLTHADLEETVRTGANFTDADITWAKLGRTAIRSTIKSEQIYSTMNYKSGNLTGVSLESQDLSEWNLAGLDLTQADLRSVLRDTNLGGATIVGTSFEATTRRGFTEQQLRSTRSYQEQTLPRVNLARNDLSGWDFSGQNLNRANFWKSNLSNASFQGANLQNADFREAEGLESATFDANTLYSQFTAFPEGFDPAEAGLTFRESLSGDVDGFDGLTVEDVELLMANLFDPDEVFDRYTPIMDLSENGNLSTDDLVIWVDESRNTFFGDANLDGEFNSTDLVQVFQAGQYEDGIWSMAGSLTPSPVKGTIWNSSWGTGDWNGDREFTSSDLIVAFEDGGYDAGSKVAAVPEPASCCWIVLAFLIMMSRGRSESLTL